MKEAATILSLFKKNGQHLGSEDRLDQAQAHV